MTTRYQRPANVAYVVDRTDDGDVVYLSELLDGSLLVLRDTSALIWLQALKSEDTDLVADLALIVGLTPDVIRDDVESFVTLLVERRLLEATGP